MKVACFKVAALGHVIIACCISYFGLYNRGYDALTRVVGEAL